MNIDFDIGDELFATPISSSEHLKHARRKRLEQKQQFISNAEEDPNSFVDGSKKQETRILSKKSEPSMTHNNDESLIPSYMEESSFEFVPSDYSGFTSLPASQKLTKSFLQDDSKVSIFQTPDSRLVTFYTPKKSTSSKKKKKRPKPKTRGPMSPFPGDLGLSFSPNIEEKVILDSVFSEREINDIKTPDGNSKALISQHKETKFPAQETTSSSKKKTKALEQDYQRLERLKKIFTNREKKFFEKKKEIEEKFSEKIEEVSSKVSEDSQRRKFNSNILLLRLTFEKWRNYTLRIKYFQTQLKRVYIKHEKKKAFEKWLTKYNNSEVIKGEKLVKQQKTRSILKNYFSHWKDNHKSKQILEKFAITQNQRLKKRYFLQIKVNFIQNKINLKKKSEFFNEWKQRLSETHKTQDMLQVSRVHLTNQLQKKYFSKWIERTDQSKGQKLRKKYFLKMCLAYKTNQAKNKKIFEKINKKKSQNQIKNAFFTWKSALDSKIASDNAKIEEFDKRFLNRIFLEWKKQTFQHAMTKEMIQNREMKQKQKHFQIWITKFFENQMMKKRMFSIWKTRFEQNQNVLQLQQKISERNLQKNFEFWKKFTKDSKIVKVLTKNFILRVAFQNWKQFSQFEQQKQQQNQIAKQFFLEIFFKKLFLASKCSNFTNSKQKELKIETFGEWKQKSILSSCYSEILNSRTSKIQKDYFNLWKSTFVVATKTRNLMEHFQTQKNHKNLSNFFNLWKKKLKNKKIQAKIKQTDLISQKRQIFFMWKREIQFKQISEDLKHKKRLSILFQFTLKWRKQLLQQQKLQNLESRALKFKENSISRKYFRKWESEFKISFKIHEIVSLLQQTTSKVILKNCFEGWKQVVEEKKLFKQRILAFVQNYRSSRQKSFLLEWKSKFQQKLQQNLEKMTKKQKFFQKWKENLKSEQENPKKALFFAKWKKKSEDFSKFCEIKSQRLLNFESNIMNKWKQLSELQKNERIFKSNHQNPQFFEKLKFFKIWKQEFGKKQKKLDFLSKRASNLKESSFQLWKSHFETSKTVKDFQNKQNSKILVKTFIEWKRFHKSKKIKKQGDSLLINCILEKKKHTLISNYFQIWKTREIQAQKSQNFRIQSLQFQKLQIFQKWRQISLKFTQNFKEKLEIVSENKKFFIAKRAFSKWIANYREKLSEKLQNGQNISILIPDLKLSEISKNFDKNQQIFAPLSGHLKTLEETRALIEQTNKFLTELATKKKAKSKTTQKHSAAKRFLEELQKKDQEKQKENEKLKEIDDLESKKAEILSKKTKLESKEFKIQEKLSNSPKMNEAVSTIQEIFEKKKEDLPEKLMESPSKKLLILMNEERPIQKMIEEIQKIIKK